MRVFVEVTCLSNKWMDDSSTHWFGKVEDEEDRWKTGILFNNNYIKTIHVNRYVPIWTRGSGVVRRSLIKPSCWADQRVLGKTPESIVYCPATVRPLKSVWIKNVWREDRRRGGCVQRGRSSLGKRCFVCAAKLTRSVWPLVG